MCEGLACREAASDFYGDQAASKAAPGCKYRRAQPRPPTKNRRLLPQEDQPTWPWPNRRRRPPALVWPETAWILLSATMAVGQDRQITTPDRAALSKRLVPLRRGRGFRQPPLSGPSASLLDDDLPSFLAEREAPSALPCGKQENDWSSELDRRFQNSPFRTARPQPRLRERRRQPFARSGFIPLGWRAPDSCRYDHSCRPYCQPWSLGRDISTKVL